MHLDAYRSCSRVEKREVLQVFWRADADGSERITRAALEYGRWAVVCCAVLVLEVIPVLAVSIGRAQVLAVVAGVVLVVLVASLCWAVVRVNTLRHKGGTGLEVAT